MKVTVITFIIKHTFSVKSKQWDDIFVDYMYIRMENISVYRRLAHRPGLKMRSEKWATPDTKLTGRAGHTGWAKK